MAAGDGSPGGTPVTCEWRPILRTWILADPSDFALKEIARKNDGTLAVV